MTANLGMVLEHRLLGALLRDPRQVTVVLDRVTGDDFPTPALGDVFDGICHLVAQGERPDPYTIVEHFAQWHVRGLDSTDPHAWVDAAGWHADAGGHADALRSQAIRGKAGNLVANALTSLRDIGTEPTTTVNQLVLQLGQLMANLEQNHGDTLSLGEILKGEDTYDWVVPGMLERGDRMIVTGNEGGGKSTLLRQIGICTAAGVHPLLKSRMTPRRVLVIDAENSTKQWRRTSRWITNRVLSLAPVQNPAEALHVSFVGRIDISRPAVLADIHRRIDRYKPDIVMIGPLYRIYPKAMNSDDEAALVLSALDSIRERDVALITEAHAAKATDNEGDRNMQPRGSSQFMGWPEFGFGLQTLKRDPTMSSLTRWRGDRDERVWPNHLYRGGELPWTPAT